MKNKKGQIMDQIPALIIPLIAIAMILVIGFLIFGEIKTKGVTQSTSITKNRESMAVVNNTAIHLPSCVPDESDATIIALSNDSASGNRTILGSGNYSVSGGFLTFKDDGLGDGVPGWSSPILVNYTCKPYDATYNGTTSVMNATDGIDDWLAIIVITVIGAMMIGMISMFRKQT